MQLWISGLQEAWNSLGPEGEVFQVYMYKIVKYVLHNLAYTKLQVYLRLLLVFC